MGEIRLPPIDLDAAGYYPLERWYPLQKRRDKDSVSGELLLRLHAEISTPILFYSLSPFKLQHRRVNQSLASSGEWGSWLINPTEVTFIAQTQSSEFVSVESGIWVYELIFHRYGTCWRGEWNNKPVLIREADSSKPLAITLQSEAKIFQSLRPITSLLQYYGVMEYEKEKTQERFIGLVFEWPGNGPLTDWTTKPTFSIQQRIHVLQGLAEVIKLLHSGGILLRYQWLT